MNYTCHEFNFVDKQAYAPVNSSVETPPPEISLSRKLVILISF